MPQIQGKFGAFLLFHFQFQHMQAGVSGQDMLLSSILKCAIELIWTVSLRKSGPKDTVINTTLVLLLYGIQHGPPATKSYDFLCYF